MTRNLRNTSQWTFFGLALTGLIALAASSSSAAEPDAKIARTFKAKCASCHNANGDGKVEQGEKLGVKDFTKADWQKGVKDADIKKAIEEGKKAPGKDDGMDPYKDKLSAEQIDGLVAYIRTLAK